MIKVLICLCAIVLTLAACENATPLPTSVPTSARAALTPMTMSSLDCRREQIKGLVEDFFTAYNRHDLARLLSLFNFTTEFSYFDNISDQKHVFRSRGELEAYLQTRFVLNDQFSVLAVELPAQDVVSFCTTNPTVAFTRSDALGQYRGNAKLIVSSGQIQGVVTSSTLATVVPTVPAPRGWQRRWFRPICQRCCVGVS